MLNEVMHSQVRRGGILPVFTSKEKKSEGIQAQTPNENRSALSKFVIPACTIGAGGVLLYLGLRKPDINTQIQKLYKKKIAQIKEEFLSFRKYATEYMDTAYKKITPYISAYKNEHEFEYLTYTAKIQDSTKGSEVLGAVDEAFAELKGVRSKDLKAGVTGMDEFRSFMYNLNHPAYQHLAQVRNGASMKVFDYSLMPRYKDGLHQEALVEAEEKLGKISSATGKKMFDTQNRLTDEHIHQSSVRMARQMLLVRKNLSTSAQTVMDYTFAKIAKLYNLGDDLQPLFRKGKSAEAFELLPKKNLKPQSLSEETTAMLNNDYLSKVLETVDFGKIDDKMIKSLFDWMPSHFDTKQMDMITDRIRLQQVVDKAEGMSENSELKTVAAKLEYLSARLEKYGAEKLAERCSTDFTDLNKQQIHSRVYYINSAGRKIGLAGLEDIDRFMIEQTPEYLNSSFKHNLKEILAHPETYFM